MLLMRHEEDEQEVNGNKYENDVATQNEELEEVKKANEEFISVANKVIDKSKTMKLTYQEHLEKFKQQMAAQNKHYPTNNAPSSNILRGKAPLPRARNLL